MGRLYISKELNGDDDLMHMIKTFLEKECNAMLLGTYETTDNVIWEYEGEDIPEGAISFQISVTLIVKNVYAITIL